MVSCIASSIGSRLRRPGYLSTEGRSHSTIHRLYNEVTPSPKPGRQLNFSCWAQVFAHTGNWLRGERFALVGVDPSEAVRGTPGY